MKALVTLSICCVIWSSWLIPSNAAAACPPAADLTVTSSSYSTIGYIHADGSILSSSYSTLGHLSDSCEVSNSSYSTLGRVQGGTVLNSSYSTIGYVRDDGTLLDSSYGTVGYIRSGGDVLDSRYSTIARVSPDGSELESIAAYLFFFQPELLADNMPPERPRLLSPEDGATQQATSIELIWRPVYDPDGDQVTYQLFLCTAATFDACSVYDIAGSGSEPIVFGWSGFLLIVGSVLALTLWPICHRGRMKGLLPPTGLLVVPFILVGGLMASCVEGPQVNTVTTHDVVNYHDVDDDSAIVSVEVSGLDSGHTYYWMVVAFDGEAPSEESEIWDFTTEG